MISESTWQVVTALKGAQSGDVFLVDWSAARTANAVRELTRTAARHVGLEVGLDPLREGLRVTVIGEGKQKRRLSAKFLQATPYLKCFDINSLIGCLAQRGGQISAGNRSPDCPPRQIFTRPK